MNEILMLMPESHFARTFTGEHLRRLRACGRLHFAPTATNHHDPQVWELLRGAHLVITGTGTSPLTEEVLDHACRLRVIINAAGSLRPIVSHAAFDRGIRLSSQAALNALPVAEYTLAMVLLELKGVNAIERAYRTSRAAIDVDAQLAHHGVYRRRVGIVSASSIGRRLIELLRPFDLDLSLYDPFVDTTTAFNLGVDLVDLDTLFATSDLITVHAPLLPETRRMIGKEQLALMRDGTILINTARGAVLDQDALISQLETGRIRAVIDVTDPEVPAPDSPLWQNENVVLTPHVAGSRGLELHRIGEGVVRDVEAYTSDGTLPHEVTRRQYSTNA